MVARNPVVLEYFILNIPRKRIYILILSVAKCIVLRLFLVVYKWQTLYRTLHTV